LSIDWLVYFCLKQKEKTKKEAFVLMSLSSEKGLELRYEDTSDNIRQTIFDSRKGRFWSVEATPVEATTSRWLASSRVNVWFRQKLFIQSLCLLKLLKLFKGGRNLDRLSFLALGLDQFAAQGGRLGRVEVPVGRRLHQDDRVRLRRSHRESRNCAQRTFYHWSQCEFI